MASTDDELEYLSPGFDPASLTMPKIRAILVYHEIQYPSSAKKADLVEIFKKELAPKGRRILATRSRIKRTSKGIIDMPSSQESTVSGDDDEDTELMPPSRATARRTPRASTEDSAPDTVRKSRTAAGPKSAIKHPRGSDSEATPELDVKRPIVRKTRKSEVAPPIKIEEPKLPTRPPLNDSPFSHDNPFQSGSSPLAAETRRKSAGHSGDRRKSTSRRRKTDGVTHERAASSRQEDGVVVPTAKTFNVPISKSPPKTKQEPEDPEPGEEFTPEEQLALVQENAANGQVDILPPRKKKRAQQSSGVANSAPWVVLMTLLVGYAAWWRIQKVNIGYCGRSNPSAVTMSAQIPEWASFIQPECEPCPQHAYCYQNMDARCEPDFVLKSHPLSLGGLIPLPPTCEPDGEKARRVKAVADKAVDELRDRRAKFECGDLCDENGKPIPTVEISEPDLKKVVSEKRSKKLSEDEFEDLWKGAIGEILGREEVSATTLNSLHSTLLLTSNSLARLPLGCAARRSARLALARYRGELIGLISILSMAVYIRNYTATQKADNARVPGLVSTTLNRLATQAALHQRGDTPEGWISSGQLRDDVLRDEFSAARRAKIWKKVEAVVEMNANVRPSVREGRTGEVSRVWEWIGNVGFLEDGWGSGDNRHSGKYIDREPSPRVEDSGTIAVADQRKWDEGRPIY